MADPSPAPAGDPPDPSAIDELLKQAASFTDPGGIPAPASTAPQAMPAPATPAPADPLTGGGIDAATLDELLRQASFEEPGATGGGGGAPANPSSLSSAAFGAPPAPFEGDSFKLPNFSQVIQDAQVSSIDLLRDVELNVKIELGRSRMLVEDVLRLSEGSVVELDKLAGDPVDVFVNERLVARGEVLVLNDNFCVRVNEIVTASKEEGL